MAAACSAQGTMHGQALAGNAWRGSVKMFGLIRATGQAVGFTAPQSLQVLAAKLLFALRGARSCPLSPSTHGPGCCASGLGQSAEQGMLSWSGVLSGGQGKESEGWSDVAAGRQTNAEQMFNYQHSVLGSLEISASKCRSFTRAYASAESWSCNIVPTSRSPHLPADRVSPGRARFASAVDGAPVGLKLGWREPPGTVCSSRGRSSAAGLQPQRQGPPSIPLHPSLQGHAGMQQLAPVPSCEPGQEQGQAGAGNCLLLTSITSESWSLLDQATRRHFLKSFETFEVSVLYHKKCWV